MSEEAAILKDARVIAVVGLSPDGGRPSHRVAAYLKDKGYRIIPVNPSAAEILGEKSYPSLDAVPAGLVDTVDIFRRADEVPALITKAIAIGAKNFWMQEGVVSEPGAETARNAGLRVVMDRCMMKEHRKLSGEEQ